MYVSNKSQYRCKLTNVCGDLAVYQPQVEPLFRGKKEKTKRKRLPLIKSATKTKICRFRIRMWVDEVNKKRLKKIIALYPHSDE